MNPAQHRHSDSCDSTTEGIQCQSTQTTNTHRFGVRVNVSLQLMKNNLWTVIEDPPISLEEGIRFCGDNPFASFHLLNDSCSQIIV